MFLKLNGSMFLKLKLKFELDDALESSAHIILFFSKASQDLVSFIYYTSISYTYIHRKPMVVDVCLYLDNHSIFLALLWLFGC